jgi:transketolase
MPIIDSRTGLPRQTFTTAELKHQAALMRGYDLVALCAAGSGHAGGTLSIMDIT